MTSNSIEPIVVVGGGPAGLMAAETLRHAGREVAVYDRMGSVGRKILIAGKGGLNLTHAEPFDHFVSRYGARRTEVHEWLLDFGPEDVRRWAAGLGVETIVGTSQRVFPADLKAAPLLRGWVRRLREQGVVFQVHHRWTGWDADGDLRFDTDSGPRLVAPPATVLALGGGSWPHLGSDGRWVDLLRARGVAVADLVPSNCGFECDWSTHFVSRHAGRPVKPVALSVEDAPARQGEFVITEHGVEGSLFYAMSGLLRERIAVHGSVTARLDLAPGISLDALTERLAEGRGRRSLSEHLRRRCGIEGARLGLFHECAPEAVRADASGLAAALKSLPLTLRRTRPLEEAISSAGGVRFEALDDNQMIADKPGVFCAGEMLDWEAPTGGYLLTACMASGRAAALGTLRWLSRRGMAPHPRGLAAG
jgi:uncharacterized flavoprotein (TIGR03862 family)